MTSFSELRERFQTDESGTLQITIPDTWMQGRTTYGGLSAALCLDAAFHTFDDLPPLRSAHITFIGPAAGNVVLRSSLLRQGKSVSYITVDMISESGLATRATFCFGKSRPSELNALSIPEPQVPPPEACEPYVPEGFGPVFLQHFDQKLASGARPGDGVDLADHHLWVKHLTPVRADPVSILALADIPPPAIVATLPTMPPLSSMTWMLNFLSEDLASPDGWYLMRSTNEHAAEGYASEAMKLWDSSGRALVSAKQNITIFY